MYEYRLHKQTVVIYTFIVLIVPLLVVIKIKLRYVITFSGTREIPGFLVSKHQ